MTAPTLHPTKGEGAPPADLPADHLVVRDSGPNDVAKALGPTYTPGAPSAMPRPAMGGLAFLLRPFGVLFDGRLGGDRALIDRDPGPAPDPEIVATRPWGATIRTDRALPTGAWDTVTLGPGD